MLSFLFRGLTAPTVKGVPLFDAVSVRARQPHWYVEGEVPDTIDGRFRALATIAALVIVRLEELGDDGISLSVALTERFIEVMESEHRELGLGDPSLGKTVRKLVGSLDRRTSLWKAGVQGGQRWRDCVRDTLYRTEPSETALDHSSGALKLFWTSLRGVAVTELADGKIG